MTYSIVDLSVINNQEWKNKGGSTRELLAWPSPADWTVRLSVATVDRSGPFSIFAGVTRWFAVLSGAGVRLSANGRADTITPASPPFQFDGAQLLHCDLIGGSTTDFNVMTTVAPAQCSVLRIRDHVQAQLRPALNQAIGLSRLLAVYSNCEQTDLRLSLDDPRVVRLSKGQLFWQHVAKSSTPSTSVGDQLVSIGSTDAIYIELFVGTVDQT